MSYESTVNSETADAGGPRFRHGGGDSFEWAKRPGFNPFKALAVIAGLAVFPPLGIAALAYFIWNERRYRQAGHGFGGNGWQGRGHRGGCGRGMGRTGNTAFDAHRAKVLNELEEERRAFEEHRAEQRRKRDQEAFDAFQAGRGKSDGKAE